jgi:hypothetical protein
MFGGSEFIVTRAPIERVSKAKEKNSEINSRNRILLRGEHLLNYENDK